MDSQDSQKVQLVERLKAANNVLVTVRNNPTVDLLSACIALTLVLDKLNKHAAAVFSGQIPNTIEFLKPEETIERNPDSLRDFIIALDKSKADKLRYKVEDKVVRIFITPYRTSLSQADLEFSQGDFNVDAVVALGAHEQQELDEAVTVHGRILHDATVMSINNTPNGNLGSINWQDLQASSISELVTQVVKDLGKEVLDEQISTALLTGIVAETERFSNEKTTPKTMSLAGELMTAGANQQLVATELEHVAVPTVSAGNGSVDSQGGYKVNGAASENKAEDAPHKEDGALEIDHQGAEATEASQPPATPAAEEKQPEKPTEEREPFILPKPGEVLSPPEELPHISNVHGNPLLGEDHPPLPETALPTATEEDEEAPPAGRSYLVGEPTLPSNTPPPSGNLPEPSKTNPMDVPPAESFGPLISRGGKPADLASPPQPIVPVVPAFPSSSALPSSPAPSTSSPAVSVPSLANRPLPAPTAASTTLPPLSALPPSLPPTGTAPVVPAFTDATSTSGNEDDQTLEDIEKSVRSPHVEADGSEAAKDLDAARSEVLKALNEGGSQPLEPLASLNANPLGADLHPAPAVGPSSSLPPLGSVEVDADGNLKQVSSAGGAPVSQAPPTEVAPNPESPANRPMDMPLPPVMNLPSANPVPPTNSQNSAPNAPPPVPPPMMPPNFMNPGQ